MPTTIWEEFGMAYMAIDGHNIKDLETALIQARITIINRRLFIYPQRKVKDIPLLKAMPFISMGFHPNVRFRQRQSLLIVKYSLKRYYS